MSRKHLFVIKFYAEGSLVLHFLGSGIRKFREPPRSPVLKAGPPPQNPAVPPNMTSVSSVQDPIELPPKKTQRNKLLRKGKQEEHVPPPLSWMSSRPRLKGGPSPQDPPSPYVTDSLLEEVAQTTFSERLRDLENWIENKFLGSGAYGEVYMYSHRYTREVLAVKKVNIQPLYAERDANVKGLKELRNEIDILKKLRHERIVAYHQSVEKEKHLYLYMDYMTGGSLRDKIKSQMHGVLSEDVSRNYTQQILEGVCYLHSQQIVHRDIKGDNVLLDKNGDVKLADFGLAKKFEKIGSKTNLVSHVGTPYWMAPEIILGKPYGRKADNWSVGCTVVEMMTGRPPLGHLEPLAAIFRVGSESFQPELVEGASVDANIFIRVALTWDAKDRPQSHELLKHPFICGSTVTREDHEKQASSDTLEVEEEQTSITWV